MAEQAGSLKNVYQAIAEVQAALAKGGIGKDRKNKDQGYAFRGIDDIYNSLASLLAASQLCILPRIISRELTVRPTKTGGSLFNVVVEAEFDFVSAADGSSHVVRTFGEAMDSADKATNKAMSAAYKYACLQVFCIPTEGDNDADATTPNVGDMHQAVSIFDSIGLRETFRDNCIAAVNNAITPDDMRTVKESNLARWNAMKVSENQGDVDAYSAIVGAYNSKWAKMAEEAKGKAAKQKTVDDALKGGQHG